MITFIEILEGSNVGSRYKVEEGATLGRGSATIVIKDPKISGIHAKFTKNEQGRWILQDLDSANGLYISGRRVKKVSLIPGVIFEIGRTKFKVVLVAEEKAEEFSRIVTWRNIVAETFSESEIPNSPGTLDSFTPTLQLLFAQGIQADEKLILGYGPRLAGADSLDIELKDEGAPGSAFELIPGPDGLARIKVLASGQVTVNKQNINAETLREGDTIAFGNTVIKVSYG